MENRKLELEVSKLEGLLNNYVVKSLSTEQMISELTREGYIAHIVYGLSMVGKIDNKYEFSKVIIKTEKGDIGFKYFDCMHKLQDTCILTSVDRGFEVFAYVYSKMVFVVDSRQIKGRVEDINKKSIEYRFKDRFGCVLGLQNCLYYLNRVPTGVINSMPTELKLFTTKLQNLGLESYKLYYGSSFKGLRVCINGLGVDIDASVLDNFFTERDYESSTIVQLLYDGECFYTEGEEVHSYEYIGEYEIKSTSGIYGKFISEIMGAYKLLYKNGKLLDSFDNYRETLKGTLGKEGYWRDLSSFVDVLALSEGVF